MKSLTKYEYYNGFAGESEAFFNDIQPEYEENYSKQTKSLKNCNILNSLSDPLNIEFC